MVADGSYFATYELIKRKLSPSPGLLPNGDEAPAPPLSIGAVILAGGAAGVGMWAIAIPPDVRCQNRGGRRTALTADDQVEAAERPAGHVLWFPGLREEAHRCGRSHGAVEGIRPSYG